MNGNHDSWLRVLVEIEAAHGRRTPLELALPIDRVPQRLTRSFGFYHGLDGLGNMVGGNISVHVIRFTNRGHVVRCWCLWLLIEVDADMIEPCCRFGGT